MRKLFWFGVLAAAFYGHSRFFFSAPSVMSWLQKQDQMAMRGEDGMCDAYATDLRFEIRSRSAMGNLQTDGGKEALCQHLKDTSTAFRATQASANHNIELVSIDASGFPWLSATVKARQTTTVHMRGAPAITEVAESTTVVRRILGGREIARFDIRSEATMGQ